MVLNQPGLGLGLGGCHRHGTGGSLRKGRLLEVDGRSNVGGEWLFCSFKELA